MVADGVPAEWVLVEGADPQKRLPTFMGAFMMGSLKSSGHATTLSRITNASVLASTIVLRLKTSALRIEDCQLL